MPLGLKAELPRMNAGAPTRYRSGTCLTDQTGHMVDSLIQTPKACTTAPSSPRMNAGGSHQGSPNLNAGGPTEIALANDSCKPMFFYGNW